jgi:hypothetical protein
LVVSNFTETSIGLFTPNRSARRSIPTHISVSATKPGPANVHIRSLNIYSFPCKVSITGGVDDDGGGWVDGGDDGGEGIVVVFPGVLAPAGVSFEQEANIERVAVISRFIRIFMLLVLMVNDQPMPT